MLKKKLVFWYEQKSLELWNASCPSLLPSLSLSLFMDCAFSHRRCYATAPGVVSAHMCVFFCKPMGVPARLKSLKQVLILVGSTASLSVCLTSSIGMTWAYPPPAAPPRHKEVVAQSEADNRTGTHRGGMLSGGLWVNYYTPAQNIAGYELLASHWQRYLITQLLTHS